MIMTRERRLKIAGLQVNLAIDERYAAALTRSLPYRYVIRPALRALNRGEPKMSVASAVAMNGTGPTATPIFDPAIYTKPEARQIAERVKDISWYHVIELPHGVVTPGRADHRQQIGLYGLPADLHGMRALDVATFDGFWAFEMERRGAEVVAIDIGRWSQADVPLRWLENLKPEDDGVTGAGFRLASELLESKVDRRELSVYDLSPDNVGTFDVVFLSDLLLHLRDPQRALERLYSVVRPDGYALIAEPYSTPLERFEDAALTEFVGYVDYIWAVPSSKALKRMLAVAGFSRVEELSRFRLDYQHQFPVQKVALKARR